MITIPFYVIIAIYGFFLAGFIILALVNVGHLITTGTFTMISFLATLLFAAYVGAVLWLTWGQLGGLDWYQPITLWNAAWLGGSVVTPF